MVASLVTELLVISGLKLPKISLEALTEQERRADAFDGHSIVNKTDSPKPGGVCYPVLLGGKLRCMVANS